MPAAHALSWLGFAPCKPTRASRIHHLLNLAVHIPQHLMHAPDQVILQTHQAHCQTDCVLASRGPSGLSTAASHRNMGLHSQIAAAGCSMFPSISCCKALICFTLHAREPDCQIRPARPAAVSAQSPATASVQDPPWL